MAIKKCDLILGRPQSWAEILREREYMPASHASLSCCNCLFLRDKLQGEVNSDLPGAATAFALMKSDLARSSYCNCSCSFRSNL